MRLLTVEAEDWMGYVHLGIDFSGMSSVAISGKNNHGKSAILDAITFCLFGVVGRKVGRGNEHFIRDGADALLLRVTFATSDGKIVEVVRENERGSTGALRLTVDDVEQTAAKIVETQARIVDLIGLDYEQLTASAWMVQRGSAAFMDADPRERKDLLIALLALDEYEPLHKAAKQIADRAEAERAAAETQVTSLALRLALADQVRAAFAAAVTDLRGARAAAAAASDALSDLRVQHAAAKAERDRLKGERDRIEALAVERDALPGRITKLRAQLDAAITEASEPEPVVVLPPEVPEGAFEDVEARLTEIRARHAEASRIETQIVFMAERVAEAEQSRSVVDTIPCGAVGIFATCPLLVAVPEASEIEEARASLDHARATLATLDRADEEQASGERTALLLAQRAYERAKSNAAATTRAWESSVRSATALATTIRDALGATESRAAALAEQPTTDESDDALATATGTVERLRVAGETARADADAARQAVTAAEEAWQRASRDAAAIDEADRQIDEWRTTFERARTERDIYAALAAAWHRDALPTEQIERALPMIEAKANEVLSRLPEELTIQLRTQRPTKRGKGMAETLDVVVTIGGFEREYGLLSWGARLRVDVALRLALGEILTHRSGQRIETLWLDEPLADLDTEATDAVLELLAAIAADFPLMVIVSHHPTFADALERHITINKDADQISHAYDEVGTELDGSAA